ncbi:MAG: M1 family metallopeptidase [Anaerolineales bacterium]|nr:M1 family metallopeptidase [Anaerolineales bacterium]
MQNKIYTFFIILLITACTSNSTADAVTPTVPTFEAPPVTDTPAIPTETPLPTGTPVPTLERAIYTLDVLMDYDAHTVTVDETILYPNLTGNQLNALVIAIVPNLWQGSFNLTNIAINGEAITTYSINGQRLDIALASFLPANETIEINIQYSLILPISEVNDPNVSRPQIFGYTQRQLNLTNWYPFVVPNINGEWILHDPWAYGEHLIYDVADYEVNLRFTDPTTAPVVASSGFAEPQADFTRYKINTARAFAISASREYQVSSTQVGDITVYSYYFPFNETPGQAILTTTAQALQVFSQKFGAYPHKSLSIVMADFKDSMEFSAFYFHSPLYYSQYDGTQMNYLTFIGVHETAHQWWFEQVASDQALQPWLDETLSTYSEKVYYENTSPDLISTWWIYRVDFFQPEGFIDIPIYEAQGAEAYRVTIYLQGAHFLEDLRARIGDEAFFAFLQDYLNQGRGKIVTANDFFRILRTHTSADISDLINQYFRSVYQ